MIAVIAGSREEGKQMLRLSGYMGPFHISTPERIPYMRGLQLRGLIFQKGIRLTGKQGYHLLSCFGMIVGAERTEVDATILAATIGGRKSIAEVEREQKFEYAFRIIDRTCDQFATLASEQVRILEAYVKRRKGKLK